MVDKDLLIVEVGQWPLRLLLGLCRLADLRERFGVQRLCPFLMASLGRVMVEFKMAAAASPPLLLTKALLRVHVGLGASIAIEGSGITSTRKDGVVSLVALGRSERVYCLFNMAILLSTEACALYAGLVRQSQPAMGLC
jgi:hypothetical protein